MKRKKQFKFKMRFSKCGFQGDEYSSRLVYQFILGPRDRATQSKLLQEPPNNMDEALLIARRFEAANATIQTFATEASATQKPSRSTIGAVNSMPTAKTCYSCNGFGQQCPTTVSTVSDNRTLRLRIEYVSSATSQDVWPETAFRILDKAVLMCQTTKVRIFRIDNLQFVIVVVSEDIFRSFVALNWKTPALKSLCMTRIKE